MKVLFTLNPNQRKIMGRQKKPEPESERSILKRGAVIGMYKMLLHMILKSPNLTEGERTYLTIDGPAWMGMRTNALKPENASRKADLLGRASDVHDAYLERLMATGCAPAKARSLVGIFAGSYWPGVGYGDARTIQSFLDCLEELFPEGRIVQSACYAAVLSF